MICLKNMNSSDIHMWSYSYYIFYANENYWEDEYTFLNHRTSSVRWITCSYYRYIKLWIISSSWYFHDYWLNILFSIFIIWLTYYCLYTWHYNRGIWIIDDFCCCSQNKVISFLLAFRYNLQYMIINVMIDALWNCSMLSLYTTLFFEIIINVNLSASEMILSGQLCIC